MYRIAVVVTLAVLFNLSARAAIDPQVSATDIVKAYIPIGFDDNDRTEVVLTGLLPNSCYRIGPSESKVDGATNTIHLRQNAYWFPGFCLQMVIPFTQIAQVGILKPADWKILDDASGRDLGRLPVTRAGSSNIDEFLYAPVSDAMIARDATGVPQLTLDIKFGDRCSRFKEARVKYYPDVIVVQPIVERVETTCSQDPNRWQTTVPLKASLKGTYLLHVRTMSGNAINKIVDID